LTRNHAKKVLSDSEIEEIAQNHVRATYPENCEILSRQRRAKPDGIYFGANVGTKDISQMLVGDGGFFVNRESGEIWQFGSGQIFHEGLAYWLKFYAEGWRLGLYQLTLQRVMKPRRFANLIMKHRVEYLVREVECNTVWHRWTPYNEETVLRRIESLPCTFVVGPKELRKMIPQLQTAGIATFEYSFAGSHRDYDTHPENNTPDQLGPQYEWA
jgi:hypothetical protein